MPDISTTDQTLVQSTATLQATKTWRPIRPVTVVDKTDDRLNQLQGKIASLASQIGNLSTTIVDTNPAAPSNAPAQVTGVSASVTAENINGALMAVVEVSFTPQANFSQAQVWVSGYSGTSSPQLIAQGFSSPIELVLQTTGELVTIKVVAVNSSGIAANFASAPSTTVLLNGTSTAPPAPTISQPLAAISGGAGWQFTFNLIGGLVSDVISGYWVYRSTSITTPSGTSARYEWIPQPPGSLPYVFQDFTSGTYYYWVSAVSVSGLESSLTATNSTNVTSYDYPTATSGPFSTPAQSYDGNEATSAQETLTSPSGGAGTNTATEVWSAFAAAPGGVTISSIQLQVLAYAATNNAGAAVLQYSLDNGVTWNSLYAISSSSGNSNSTPKQYYAATLSNTQDLTQVQVKALCSATSTYHSGGYPGGTGSYWDQGVSTQSIYECRIAVAYH